MTAGRGHRAGRTGRVAGLLVVAALALAVPAALLPASGAVAATPLPRAERLVVVSMPGVSWRDVDQASMPTLDRFASGAAVGDLSTRIGRRGAEPVTAYLTMGAGTRSVDPVIDRGVALDGDEAYGLLDAHDLLLRRLGVVPEGIAYLGLGAARDANESSPYGAEVGLLGDLLEAAGVSRAVIANADEVEGVENDPPEEGAYRREAALALMGSDGRVPVGAVGRDLLEREPTAPFGRRMDPALVAEAFARVWPPAGERGVVLVEASDLTRAASYAGRSTASQGRAMRATARRGADELLAEVLAQVDPARDAVLVLSPVAPRGQPDLGVVAVQAPGVTPGFLRSATTRRDGYVQLADVMPTILELVGVPAPDDVEGRGFRVGAASERRPEQLVDAAEAAGFRDRMVPVVTIAFVAVLALLSALASHEVRSRGSGSARWVLGLARAGGWAVLGAAAGTYLAGLPDRPVTTVGPFLLWVGLGAVSVAGAAALAERARPGAGTAVALAALVVVVGVDVLVGAPLQVNTIFGYSMAVAGRFAGLGNLAFALFGSAAVLLAAVLAQGFGEAGRRVGSGVLVAVLLVEGLPMLGADVGGILAMVPAFGVTALLLAGRRVGWAELGALGAAAAVTVTAFAFVDLTRPEPERTHLSRLAEHLMDGRWTTFVSSLTRRWQASFGGSGSAVWATVGVLAVVVAGYVAFVVARRRGRVRRPAGWPRPALAAAAGLAVLALVGLVANDSSFAVPSTMLIVAVPVVIDQLARRPRAGWEGAR